MCSVFALYTIACAYCIMHDSVQIIASFKIRLSQSKNLSLSIQVPELHLQEELGFDNESGYQIPPCESKWKLLELVCDGENVQKTIYTDGNVQMPIFLSTVVQ